MRVFLNIIADIFFSPAAGMARAAQIGWEKAVAFLFVFLLVIYWPLAYKMLPGTAPGRIFAQFALQFFLQYSLVFVYCLMVHGLSGLFFRTAANIRQLLAAMPFIFLPFAFLSPLSLLAAFSGSYLTQAAAAGFFFLWMSALAMHAVGAVYSLNTPQALLLAVLPAVIFLSAVAAAVFYLALLTGFFTAL